MKKRRGFSLFEAMISALILMLVGTGMAAAYIAETGLALRVAHRLEAVNYGRGVAEKLLVENQYNWSRTGLHTEKTDPSICALPDCYFKNVLGGVLTYNVRKPKTFSMTLVDITVEWQEPSSKAKKEKEVITIFRR